MKSKHKYISYITGLLLGTVIVALIFTSKAASKRKLMNEPFPAELEQYSLRVLPGQVFDAKSPLYADTALFTQDYAFQGNGSFKRALIYEEHPKDQFFRIEETLWKSPQTGNTHLVKRQAMMADRLIIRLNRTNRGSYIQLRQILNTHGLKLIESKTSSLHVLQLPTHGPSSVPQAIKQLTVYNNVIEAVHPVYLFNHTL